MTSNERHKLSQFRRHPDWKAAEQRVIEKHKHQLFVWSKDHNCWALPDENVNVFIEMVDGEFIDEIIYKEKLAAAHRNGAPE